MEMKWFAMVVLAIAVLGWASLIWQWFAQVSQEDRQPPHREWRMKMNTEFSHRMLMGSDGKPEGEETWGCKTCGALVADCDTLIHANWHERLRKATDERQLLD